MLSSFVTLMVLVALAIPILIVAKIVRRVREVSNRLGDPTRLQRVFAESAAAALRRAGADPKAIARIEVLGMGGAGAPQLPPMARPRPATVRAEHRPPRLRRPHAPVTPLGGFEMGDRFRLSEPPEISEPRGPLSFNANWLAAAVLVGAVAYYLLR